MIHDTFTHIMRSAQDGIVGGAGLIGGVAVARNASFSTLDAATMMEVLTPYLAMVTAAGGLLLLILRIAIAVWELRQRMHEKRMKKEVELELLLDEDGKSEG